MSQGAVMRPDDKRVTTPERGLVTQQALAERWGVSRGNLSKILNRKAYINA